MSGITVQSVHGMVKALAAAGLVRDRVHVVLFDGVEEQDERLYGPAPALFAEKVLEYERRGTVWRST